MATPDREDDLKEIKKSIKQLQEGQGGGERPGFLRALKDYVLDVKDTPQASVSKSDEKESKGGALSEKDSKNLADIAKTNRVIAKALVESAREVRREKRRGVEPRIPSASTGATVTPAATATGGKQVAALLREPVTQQPQPEGAPGTPGPTLPVPDIDLPDRRTPPKPPAPAPTQPPKPPAGKPSILQRGVQLGKELLTRAAPVAAPAAPYALAAGALAAPFIAAGISKRKIDEDPNAPGLQFQPYAMSVRGEAKTEGQAGRQNRDRAVRQFKWGEIKDYVDSNLTDEELVDLLGNPRKELKAWLDQNKDGKKLYIKPSGAGAPQVTPATQTGNLTEQQVYEKLLEKYSPQMRKDVGVQRDAREEAQQIFNLPANQRDEYLKQLFKGSGGAQVRSQKTVSTFDAAKLAEEDPETHRKFVERQQEIIREKEKQLQGMSPRDQARARERIQAEAFNQAAEEFTPQASRVGAASTTASSREDRRVQQMEQNAQKVRDTAESLGLDPNKVTGRFEGGKLTGIIDETGKQVDVSDRLSEEDKKSVNAARSMRAAMQGTQQPTPQVEPAKPEPSTTKDEETGPVSGMEAGIMRAEGLDPESEFDRKLYRRRRETERAQAATRANATGAELNTMSVQNNDLQRQGNTPSSQPIVIQNNSAPTTQTTVTPPAQPRVDSSFSRVMDIRNFWD